MMTSYMKIMGTCCIVVCELYRCKLYNEYLYSCDRYNATNSYKYFGKLAFEKRIKIIQPQHKTKNRQGISHALCLYKQKIRNCYR